MGNTISIGKRVPSIESYNKATGRTLFTADIRMPRMLYAKMLRSPYAHARIINIDTERAIKLNGVKAVITYKDVPRFPYNSSCPNFFGPQIKLDQYIFDSKVRYAGEEVTAVAAETEEIAEEAIELIEVTYKQLPAILNVEEALKPEAPKIHPGGNIAGQETFKFGDIEKGFKDADRIFEDAYKLSAVNPCPIEPHACICSFDSAGKLKVLSAHQKPFPLRKWLSFALGMPIDKVEIIKPPVGGGFGAKQDMVIEPHCALLSKMTGRPVRMEFTREEQFKVGRRRHSGVVKVKTGVKRDGMMIARRMEALLDTGAYSSHGYNVMFATGAWFATLYKSPHTLFEGKAVYTNTSIAGAMRGFGDPQATFAVESQMDAIAEELGIDPIELRLKNALKQGDPDPFSGAPIATCGLKECLEEGAKAIGWHSAKKRTLNKGAKKRGIGLSTMVYGSGVKGIWPEFSSAIVRINEDASVNVVVGTAEIGTGTCTVLAQIAAEEIGIPPERVTITSEFTTDAAPFDLGTYGSRTTYVAGNAVKAAAADAKRQLLESAARFLETSVEDLEIKDERICSRSSSKQVSIADVVMAVQYGVSGSSTIMGKATVEAQSCPYVFGAHFAEVEVDTESGETKVLRMVVAHDVGKALNPTLVEGQLEGAAYMGLGYALKEELLWDSKTGALLNPNFLDYKTYQAEDMPKIETIIVETREPTGPFGAKSVGEQALIPVAPAIANAIYSAIGIRVREIPITPERVLAALEAASRVKQVPCTRQTLDS